MVETVLSEKGQVVIPAAVRERMGLRRGDRFTVEMTQDGVIFRLLPRSPLLELRGAFKGPASLTGALMEEHRAEKQMEHG